MNKDWPFTDPENVAVYTTRQIVSGEEWIHYVSHDEDDGAWQFHSNNPDPVEEEDAKLVSLKRMTEIDPSILDLADLPLGWHAIRASKDSSWKKERQTD